MRRCALTLLVVLAGCGPDLEPITDCEGDGPTQLVELREGPSSSAVMWGARDERGWLVFDGDGDDGRNLAVECGQPPRVFAHDIPNVLRLDPKGPWLGYRHPSGEWAEFFVLDPWGGAPPRPLPPYLLGVVDDGLLLGDSSLSGGGRVSLWHAKFGDAFDLEPIELDLRTTAEQFVSLAGSPYVTSPVELVFVTIREDGQKTTLGFDPRTGERRFSEAKDFVQSRMGGRFVILSDHVPGEPWHYAIVDTSEPSRRIESFPSPHGCCRQPDLVVSQRYEGEEAVETRIVTLPDLREFVLEGEWTSWNMSRAMPDGRRILLGPTGFHVLEPDSSTLELIHPRHGFGWIVGEDLWVAETAWPDSHLSAPHERALVRVPLDGSPVITVLEPPLESWFPLSHGRWALTRENRDGRADLRIYDPSSARETIVVEDIDVGFSRWNHSGFIGSDWTYPQVVPEPDDILFAQTGEDGRAIWRFTP